MLLPARRGTRSPNRTTSLGACALLLALLLLGAAATAGAEPSVEAKRVEAEAVLAEVRELGAEVGAAAERFNGANYELDRLSGEAQTTRQQLKRARGQLRLARARAGERLVELYVEGSGSSTLEVFLSAGSIAEVMDSLEAQERVVEQDDRSISAAGRLRDRTRVREQKLRAALSSQQKLVARLEAERAEIESRLAQRQELLESVQVEVAQLEAKERARQAEVERRALALIARQQQAARSTAAPREADAPAEPAPVETATAEPAEPATAPAPPADASKGAQVVAIASQYLGIPYKWGGASPATGFDCSGFTMYVFAKVGVSLPHYAAAQFGLGLAVSRSELQPGDLVFFRGLGHMGMYIGGGNMIHAPQTGDVVKISSLSLPYYVSNWVGARRVL